MNTQTSHSLAEYRKQHNIPLHDIAFIGDIDIGNLSKMERGIREPNPAVILLYHILFEAPVHNLFKSRLLQEQEGWKMRSIELIKLLEQERPPQSSDRIKFTSNFVNRLAQGAYA